MSLCEPLLKSALGPSPPQDYQSLETMDKPMTGSGVGGWTARPICCVCGVLRFQEHRGSLKGPGLISSPERTQPAGIFIT